ncbi:helix-turn-helix transcriptional regulator [Kitasatospora sp. NBC_01560]|uniref:helix-turn-helix transcriptional regulator n=1 Tax=Kitasatospora sp. NBC_01560 TaxID=2975965 RepID=UPI00386B428C
MGNAGTEHGVEVERALFVTHEEDAARQFLDAAYGSRLRLSGLSEGGLLRYERIDAGLFTVDRITLPGTLSFACEPIDRIVVNDLRAGKLEVSSRDREEQAVEGDLVLNPVAVPYGARSAGSTIDSVTVDTDVVRDAAGALAGEPLALTSAPAGPVGPAAARVWRACVDLVAEQFAGAKHVPPLVVSQAARLLGAAAVAAFPTAPPPPAPEESTGPATLRRAIAYIESNAQLDIRLTDIAAAARVTPRALQYAFRRGLDMTPMAYLRRVRLDAAHRELLAADPGTTTVTQVAMQWGFAHPGHFAARYRDAYQVPPSATLLRSP